MESCPGLSSGCCFLPWASACALPVPAVAQTDVNDVHVMPREVKPHEAEKAKTEEIASETVVPASLNTHIRPLKVAVDLVLVPVTITDPMNRLVTGLEKDNFQLFEGSSKEEIKSFSSEDAPVSLGVIFDSSGSMVSKMDRAKDAVIEFFKTANPQDEFFMITFSDEPDLVTDFTSSVDDIQDKLLFTAPRQPDRAAGCHLHGRQQDEAGKVSEESAPHHLRRGRQSQPLYRE